VVWLFAYWVVLPAQTLAPDRRSKKITESEKIKGKGGKRTHHNYSVVLQEKIDFSRGISRMQALVVESL
jgi:hypothetical protein